MIEPEKFYRCYFNALISKTPENKQNINREEKFPRHKSSNNFPNFAEERRYLSPRAKLRRGKTFLIKK